MTLLRVTDRSCDPFQVLKDIRWILYFTQTVARAGITASTENSEDPRIRAALERAIALGETGITAAAYHHGDLIVDSYAGIADINTGQPVSARTRFPVFSVTKGVTALAIHIQADRGIFNLDDKISKYWPEFAANGKESITVTQALSHCAGIPQMLDGVTPELMADWDWTVKRVAEFTPVFPPGPANAYHILVLGWILGEVVRRTDPSRRPFEVFVQEEILISLGISDFYLGVPEADLSSVATLSGGNSFPVVDNYNTSSDAVFPGSTVHNLSVVRRCVDPGAGGITTAPAVARIFAMIAESGSLDGVRLLSQKHVLTLTKLREGACDPDKILPMPVSFGAAEYWWRAECL